MVGNIIMKKDMRRKVNSEIIEKMRKLRKEGSSYVKIADELKLSQMTVYNYLKKKGKPIEEEKPAEEKKEKKVGFWARLFGRKKKPAETEEKPAEEKKAW